MGHPNALPEMKDYQCEASNENLKIMQFELEFGFAVQCNRQL